MTQRNYEMLGRKWCYNKPLPQLLERLLETDARFTNAPDSVTRSAQIRDKLMYPALQHLGFGRIECVLQQIEGAVDLALDFFLGAWWYPDSIRCLAPDEFSRFGLNDPAQLEKRIDAVARTRDKSRPDRELVWYTAYRSALFLAGLAGRWDHLAKIGSWFDATIEPEYQAGQIEDEYMQLFVCIAGSLAPQPMAGAEELLAKVKKCRTKRPRLLCAAWEAANAADQVAFNKAFPETVNHFLSKPEGGQAYDWLAIDQSSVWLIAEHRGLTFPPLSEKQQAAVVTRQSVGLAD